MPAVDKLNKTLGLKAPEEVITVTPAEPVNDEEANHPDKDSQDNGSIVSDNVQNGVANQQAITLSWTKKSLAFLFINMWFIYLVNGFQSKILSDLTAYALSDFGEHSLIPLIGVVASVMTAAVYIPLAKILDIWGRAEGFLLMVTFATIGMGAMAGSHNVATYCAAQVFYNVGWSGIIYTIDVMTADSTKLQNRGFAYAFTSSPYMITAFAGPKSSEAFLKNVNWRWAFGTFTIVLPFVAAPMYILLKYQLRKAKKNGLLLQKTSDQPLVERVKHGIVEFDLVGVFLFAAGIVTFLVPFSIASSAPHGWKSDYIIAMIIVGFLVTVSFFIYEIYVAPVPFFQTKFLKEPTIAGACLLDFIYQISYYCWVSYFTSFLQVVQGLPVSEAGYINNTFDVVSGLLLFIVGILMSKTGRFKWLLVCGIPWYIFSQGLMIYFRRPNQSVGYLIMCEIFISIAGSCFILCMQVAVLASVDHQHVATVLAILSITGGVGGAIGGTVSTSIWTNTFGVKLLEWLPENAKGDFAAMYEDLTVQLSYPEGHPVRIALQRAYGYAQTRMLAVGTGVMVVSIASLFLIKNFDLRKLHQTKGVVF